MDIWRWVGKKQYDLEVLGEHRLSQIVSDIPSFTCDDHHHKVDQLFPEGLALARQLDDKWVELFLRHWHLQSQVLHRENAKGLLNEAIDLLDFAHQEDTKGCPQRICVVQDLASCYGIIDGPGFATERLQVTEETLAEINGSWPCYQCVATELIDALYDTQQYQQALDKIDAVVAEVQRHDGGGDGGSDLCRIKARTLIKLGRLDEAQGVLQNARRDGGGESFLRSKTLSLSLLSALNGDYKTALSTCLSFDEIQLAQGYFDDWCEIHYLAAKAKAIEIDAELLDRFHYLASKKCENGVIRGAIVVYSQLAELAMASDSVFTAKIAIREISALLPQLNRDLGASEQLKRLEDAFTDFAANIVKDEVAEDIEEFVQQQYPSIEFEAYGYEIAYIKWPKSTAIVLRLCELYEYYRQYDLGLKLLQEAYYGDKTSADLQYNYGHFLLTYSGASEFFHEFDKLNQASLTDDAKLNVYWLYSRAHFHTDKKQASDYLEKFLELRADSVTVLSKLAELNLAMQNHAKAIEHLNTLITLEPEEINHHWDRLVPATLIENWQLVRESSQAIGIEVESEEGPVNQDMGSIRIQFEDTDIICLAKRTGPVSATVIGVNNISEKQYYGYQVVFTPVALNQLDQKDEEGYDCDAEGHYTHVYAVHEITKSPENYVFTLDGFHPGEPFINSLKLELEAKGLVLSQRSSDEYRIDVTQEKGPAVDFMGWYAYLLGPAGYDFNELNGYLKNKCSELQRPIIWPMLLEKIGDEDCLKQHLAIEQAYEL